MGLAGELKFMAMRRITGCEVPDSPVFSGSDGTVDEGAAWFLATLKGSKRYLEFGTGGSTFQAAKMGIEFIAVDSDSYYLKTVREKIRYHGYALSKGQTYHYADIGPTAYGGYPILVGSPSSRRLDKFRRYSDPPAECFADGLMPDLVLVNGRFRVACVLKSLRMLREVAGWTIVMDDFSDRPHYNAITEFAEIDRLVNGGMALITSMKDVDPARLDEAIRRYETESS